MRRLGGLLLLLSMTAVLAACGSAATSSAAGEVSQSAMEIQVYRVSSDETSAAPSSTASSSDAVAEAEILDLFYTRLAAVKKKDAAAYLAVYPAAYADRLQITDKNLTEYKKAFSEKCKTFLTALGGEISLSAEIVGRSDLSEEALRTYRSDFKTDYSEAANITDIRRLRIRCTYTGETTSRTGTDWYVAYAVDGEWYLSPESQLF